MLPQNDGGENGPETIVGRINSIFYTLSSKKDLSPNEHTNALLSSLVELALTSNPTISNEVLVKLEQNGKLQSLIDLCGAAEIELEKYWARRIIDGKSSITEFPYYRNYAQLTEYELQQMRRYTALDGKKMFFAGSGSIPLTPIMFKEQQPSLELMCIDRDEECVGYANRLLLKLGLNGLHIGHHNTGDLDATMQLELSSSDVMFIAALVGNSNRQKNQILSDVHAYLIHGSLIVVRSVPDDMRRLLYPKFELEGTLKTKYEVVGEYSLSKETGVINSIVIMRRI